MTVVGSLAPNADHGVETKVSSGGQRIAADHDLKRKSHATVARDGRKLSCEWWPCIWQSFEVPEKWVLETAQILFLRLECLASVEIRNRSLLIVVCRINDGFTEDVPALASEQLQVSVNYFVGLIAIALSAR